MGSCSAYCPSCKKDLVELGNLLKDDEYVQYLCANCSRISRWNFDAPLPILLEGRDVPSPTSLERSVGMLDNSHYQLILDLEKVFEAYRAYCNNKMFPPGRADEVLCFARWTEDAAELVRSIYEERIRKGRGEKYGGSDQAVKPPPKMWEDGRPTGKIWK